MPSRYRTILPILFLILLLVIISVPVTALKVEGAKIMLDVKPGTTYIFPMAVSIKPDDSASEYAIDILGFGQSLDAGLYQGLPADKDTGLYSARSYISFPSATVYINPGERKEFNATVKLPSNIGEGGRYAVVLIHPAAAGSGQAAIATAVLVPVMLTVQGSKLVETGTITSIDVGEIVEAKPITVTTTLRNTGNHHYYGVVNQVTITDAGGKTVASAKTDPFSRAVIPGQSVRFDAPVSTPLAVGTYTVKSEMMLESGTVLDSSSTSVTVKEAYIPPFTESAMKITPDNPATIKVPEGTITLSFPQGSVLSDTTVTVKPFTGTLPALPSGATAGTTAFAIDGLSGLLAKDATVTVKYASGDLAAAGGKTGKLALARYDRSDSGWTVLPTTVDSNAMTLTAATNRFSTWVVIATDSPPSAGKPAGSTSQSAPGPEPLLIFGLLAVVVLVKCGWKRP